MCAQWPWPWRYDLRSRSWHILGYGQQFSQNIFHIQQGSEELLPVHEFWACVHCDLDLGSRSWHILGLWTTIVKYDPDPTKKLWPGHAVNRWTDRQGDSYLPSKLCLWGYNKFSNLGNPLGRGAIPGCCGYGYCTGGRGLFGFLGFPFCV